MTVSFAVVQWAKPRTPNIAVASSIPAMSFFFFFSPKLSSFYILT